MSDQHGISPDNTNWFNVKQVSDDDKENINKGTINWLNTKFSELAS